MAKHFAADRIGNALWAGYFLAPVEIEAVAVVMIAAQLADQGYRLTLLRRRHPGQRAVWPPFDGRQVFDKVDCLSLFSFVFDRS
ncbi:hypothetical protein SDC9_190112 [bioreactor metagenome]|uniref:Uncharacterized protein n=1 Tax=bioreactor metagenome TaxID=1076179 RepID=A0A645HU24_9ZZZZ